MATKFSAVMDFQKALKDIKELNKNMLRVQSSLNRQQVEFKKTIESAAKMNVLSQEQASQMNKVAAQEERRAKAAQVSKKAQESMVGILKKTPFAFIEKLSNNIKTFNDRSAAINKAGGYQKVFTQFVKNSAAGITDFGKNAKQAFGGIFTGALKNAGSLFKLLATSAASFAVALGPILVAVGAILAIVYVLRKAWQFNIGGMQTQWFQFTGKIKDVWGRFNVDLLKTLQGFAPVFKTVFGAILSVLSGIFRGIVNVIRPVMAAGVGLVKTLQSAFASLGIGGKEAGSFWKTIGDILAGVGSVIGFVLGTTIKVVGASIKLFTWIAKITGYATFLKKSFEIVGNVAGFIVDKFKDLFGWIVKILDKFGLLNKENEDIAKNTSNTFPNAVGETPVSGFSRAGNVTNNNQTFSPNLSVTTSAPIDAANAPMMMDSMLSVVSRQRMMR